MLTKSRDPPSRVLREARSSAREFRALGPKGLVQGLRVRGLRLLGPRAWGGVESASCERAHVFEWLALSGTHGLRHGSLG